jgi:class 3 adenylate cyclase
MARRRTSSLVVLLTATKRSELEALQRRTTVAAGLARRARMVLLRADGSSLTEVARQVGGAPRVVAQWIKRYRQQGLRGLGDKARPGRPPGCSPRRPSPAGQVGL